MNHPDLIWRLIELILQQQTKINELNAENVKGNSTNSQEQDEV